MVTKDPLPLPGFAALNAEENAFFASRGEVGGEPATSPEPEPDLTPAEPAEPVETGDAVEALPDEAAGIEGEQPPLAAEELEPARRQPPRSAPIPALQAERERRQQAEQRAQQQEDELRQHREWRARIDERLRMVNEQRQAAMQQVPPDPNEDPEGYRNYIDQQRETRIQQLEARLAQTEQGSQQNAVLSNVASMTQSFAARTPDYFEAAAQLRERLDQDLQLGGYDDPNERQFMINQWSEPIIRKALSRGMNPAEAIYRIAKYRVGGAPLPTPATRAVAPPGNVSKVAAIRRGQTATRSLGRTPGKDMSEGLTLDRLLNASANEFARLMAEQPDAVAALMGK